MDAETKIDTWLRRRGINLQPRLLTAVPVTTEAAYNDVGFLLDEIEDFQVWAETEAMLRPGEYPTSVWLGAILCRYVNEIHNGGHDQWVANLRFDKFTIEATGFGLELLGLEDAHAIWRRYAKYSSNPIRRLLLRDRWGWGTRDAASLKADNDFMEIGSERVRSTLANWLRTSGALRPVDPGDVQAERTRIIASIPVPADRKALADRDVEERDPLSWIVRDLSRSANITLSKTRLADDLPTIKRKAGAISQLIWFVNADGGVVALVIEPASGLGKATAMLAKFDRHNPNATMPLLAEVQLTKRQYNSVLDYFAIARRA